MPFSFDPKAYVGTSRDQKNGKQKAKVYLTYTLAFVNKDKGKERGYQ